MQFHFRRSFFALSVLSLSLLPLAGTAQAKPKNDRNLPPDYAPAYGRRNDDPLFKGNYGRSQTLEAVVTSNENYSRGTDSFQVQAKGRSFDVQSNKTVRVRRGDRVVLRGAFDQDGDFVASSVSNGNYGDADSDYNDPDGRDVLPGRNGRVTINGVVTRVFKSGDIQVRAENGQLYSVDLNSNEGQYQVGNRVRVKGKADGDGYHVQNARVTFQNGGVVGPIFGGGNTNGNSGGVFGHGNGNRGTYSDSTGQRVNFPGQIVSLTRGSRTATVRGDNGRTYTIHGEELRKFHQGDRVRVIGMMSFGTIQLTDIDHE